MAADRTGRGRPDRGQSDRNVSPERVECGWFLAVVMGLVASVIALVVVFIAVAVYDYVATPHAAVLDTLASAGGYLATGIGGFVAGRKSGRRGLTCGGLVGLVFAAGILTAGAGSPVAVPFTGATLQRLLFSAVAGGVGGMFGVAST